MDGRYVISDFPLFPLSFGVQIPHSEVERIRMGTETEPGRTVVMEKQGEGHERMRTRTRNDL